MTETKDASRKKLFRQMAMRYLAVALLALLLIFPLRGMMNAVSRLDYIAQRLDDYPRMKEAFFREQAEWSDWWQKEVYGQSARQAAFIYETDKKHAGDAGKLAYIAEILRAEKAEILSAAEHRAIEGQEQDLANAPRRSFAELPDGRVIALEFSGSEDRTLNPKAADTLFLSQLEAGLPGHICVVRDGAISIYPEDESAAEITGMIGKLMETGRLDPAALAEQARAKGKQTELKVMRNPAMDGMPARKYILYGAAYTESDDFVVNVASTDTLIRFGRKRSWSLWFLFCAVMVLLGRTLWRTRLYKPGDGPEDEFRQAIRGGMSAMLTAAGLVLASVFMTQMLSGVNLAQQGARDQSAYIKMILSQESEKASAIEREFDKLFVSRAQAAAQVLTDNPQLIDTDALYGLDSSLSGAGLRVFDVEGLLLGSDDVMQGAVDASRVHLPAGVGGLQPDLLPEGETEENLAIRYYRALMINDEGKTIGWVELMAKQAQLDALLKDTGIREVIGDLRVLDTLHAAAVEKTAEGKIAAGTDENWIGDPAEEHGIHTELLRDGYEGIVSFDGSKCYSVVFDYGNHHVVVGSENETDVVFIGGVLLLSWLLSCILLLFIYRPLVRRIVGYQKEAFASDPKAHAAMSEYPMLQNYMSDFMIAVFLLSAVLYFTTVVNPNGLTYNIVHGTWIRGVNAATITTCVMLASMVSALGRLTDVLLRRTGKYLSPKGRTICRLIRSGFTYIGTIALIIYALSMFGVNTATLIGGVGATALIFTLGANSLIADVLAGIFIIFEGDFTVGDTIVINDFRGEVTDISMRTTKLLDDTTRDIKIISNSTIRELVNQSREISGVTVEIPFKWTLSLEKSEEILRTAIRKLPEMFPQLIGPVEYWGISQLPKKREFTGEIDGPKAIIAFNCREEDREMLTYKVYRYLVGVISDLQEAK